MTTAIALDPATELRHTVEERDGVEPILTIALEGAATELQSSSGIERAYLGIA